MEMLRDQEHLKAHSLSAGYLLQHLEALSMIGQYNPEAVGEQKMILGADGVEQLEHRNFYDDVFVGTADEAKAAQYLVDHFQYVCRLGISWHKPDLQASWETKKKILERILVAENASHERYMQDKVTYSETSPDPAVNAPISTRLKEFRDRKMYIAFAKEIRQIISLLCWRSCAWIQRICIYSKRRKNQREDCRLRGNMQWQWCR